MESHLKKNDETLTQSKFQKHLNYLQSHENTDGGGRWSNDQR